MAALLQVQGHEVFAVSGYGRPEHRRLSQVAGFDEHLDLVKPVDFAQLQALLERRDISATGRA